MNLRIRDYREWKNMTQKDVARLLLCDQSLLSKYERGEREIPLGLIDKMADLYGTSVDFLIGRTDDARPYAASKKKHLWN